MDTPVGIYVRLPVSYWEKEEDRQLKTAMEIAEVGENRGRLIKERNRQRVE